MERAIEYVWDDVSGSMARSGILGILINRALGAVNLRLVRASSFAQTNREQTAAEQLPRQLIAIEDYLLDLLQLHLHGLDPESLVKLRIMTNHPIAIESADHISPRGAKNDNTRHPRFVAKCGKVFGREIFHLDLGCAGGGLVWDFLIAGHQSYGVEGSDYPLVNQRAMWRLIPNNLFTADITKPFRFLDRTETQRRFDLITAWEVLEHIPKDALSGFFENLKNNLDDNGLFVASVTIVPDYDVRTGTTWHVTIEPQQWWSEQFEKAGFRRIEDVFSTRDYPRGSGNPRAWDWDVTTHPTRGFHICMQKK